MFTHLEQALNTSVPTCTVLITRYVGNSNGDRRMKASFCVGDLTFFKHKQTVLFMALSSFPDFQSHCDLLLEMVSFCASLPKTGQFPET